MKTNNTLGDTIRSLRKRAKMTQEELAEGICSPVSISRIENGNQMPSGNVLDALLERLGTSTYQLCSIYYKTDRQTAFEKDALHVAELIRTEHLDEAKKELATLEESLDGDNDDNRNRQCYLLELVGIQLREDAEPAETLQLVREAISLTQPDFNERDFSGTLLTVQEVNLINALIAALHNMDESERAVRVGEELMRAFKQMNSTISEYTCMEINTAMLLARILGNEDKYAEALMYCQYAESLSINSGDHSMLPDIEFTKASLFHSTGRDEECLSILKAILPYMELIQQKNSAETVRDYAREALGLEL